MYVDLAEVALDKQHRELRAEKETLASITSRRDAQASVAGAAALALSATIARTTAATKMSTAIAKTAKAIPASWPVTTTFVSAPVLPPVLVPVSLLVAGGPLTYDAMTILWWREPLARL